MTKTVLEVLEGALEILRDPKRWTKGTLARDSSGKPTDISGNYAVCFCASGAIIKASFNIGYMKARHSLSDVVGNCSISWWNDAPERTHAEIIQGFEKAIAVERAK
jgi:hypothetical protein